ncbi:MAG: glycosyltransferase family 4 protein [Methanobacterium sp.]
MSKEKVLISVGHFYPHIGGHEKYVLELYSRLTDKFDVDVLVSDFEGNSTFERYKGLNINRLDSWCLLGNTYPIPKITRNNYKILKKILSKEYLFINIHTRFFFMAFVGYLLSKIKKTKLIHTEHGTGTAIYENRIVELISYIFDITLGSIIVKGSELTIGVSEASSRFLEKLGSKRVFLIPNGVDTDFVREKPNNLRNSLKIKDNDIVITFIGRLVYSKGVQDLIKAFKLLENKKLKLIIVGDGAYSEELQKLAGIDENILFLGYRKDIPEILSITDIFVNPSHYENVSTSILEAASVYCPIVATNVGGTKELFIEEMGYLVAEKDPNDIANAINKIILNESNILNPQKTRKHIINNYSWTRISKKFVKIIEDNLND